MGDVNCFSGKSKLDQDTVSRLFCLSLNKEMRLLVFPLVRYELNMEILIFIKLI